MLVVYVLLSGTRREVDMDGYGVGWAWVGMVGHGWVWLGMVGSGWVWVVKWVWVGMVGKVGLGGSGWVWVLKWVWVGMGGSAVVCCSGVLVCCDLKVCLRKGGREAGGRRAEAWPRQTRAPRTLQWA